MFWKLCLQWHRVKCSSRFIIISRKYVHYESNDNVIKYYGSVIPHDRIELWKNWRANNCGRFWGKLTSNEGKLIRQSMSHTEFGELLHTLGCNRCVKGNYNRMAPISIGEQQTPPIMSNLHVWVLFLGSHLTWDPTASTVLTKWRNWELLLAINFCNPCTNGYQSWWPKCWLPDWFVVQVEHSHCCMALSTGF